MASEDVGKVTGVDQIGHRIKKNLKTQLASKTVQREGVSFFLGGAMQSLLFTNCPAMFFAVNLVS